MLPLRPYVWRTVIDPFYVGGTKYNSTNNERNLMAYVSTDGSFGSDEAILFDNDELTDKEWEILDWMSDNERYDYVVGILNKKGK